MTAQPTFSPAPQAAGSAPTPERRTGRVVVVIFGLVVLAGLGVGALFLFGTKTVDTASVQQEIDRITRSAVEVAPADVRCPVGIEAQAGGTFTCTAMVDGQPVTYWVHQNDDQGNLTVTYDRLLRIDSVEASLADTVSQAVDVAVTVDCGPADRTVLVNSPGEPISCTATNASDEADGAQLSATIDADGAVSYQFV
jgi:uncharacterized protein DUF4333